MRNLILFLLAAIVLAGCQSKPVAGETITVASGFYKNVSPVELKVMLKNKDFVFVNVHIPFAGISQKRIYPFHMIRSLSPSTCPGCRQIKIPGFFSIAVVDA